MRVVLGVGGGIAAYKVCSLVRLFREVGHDVTVVPTASALRFVGTATWEALSGHPVHTDVWSDVASVPHVRIGQQADLVVVAPATADLLAKAAGGHADDLLTATLLTARCPVLYAPAMHTEMWEHPATRANVATLRARGASVLNPASGRLTGSDTGPGRLPEPADLYAACLALLRPAGPLTGRRVVVTAGGTREPLDPVRFLGNRSSGTQGVALATCAVERGAQVTLVACNVGTSLPPGVTVVRTGTARELQAAVGEAAWDADVVVMCAAVADFRPARYAAAKIKKDHRPLSEGAAVGQAVSSDAVDEHDGMAVLELVRNPDILAGLVRDRAPRGASVPYLVGFAAETGDETGSPLELARAKLARKGCDLLVANEVGVDKVFGAESNTVHLLFADGRPEHTVGPASKLAVAAGVWDAIASAIGAVD